MIVLENPKFSIFRESILLIFLIELDDNRLISNLDRSIPGFQIPDRCFPILVFACLYGLYMICDYAINN